MCGMSPLRLAVLLFTLLTLPLQGLAAVAQRSCQDQMSATSHTAQVGDCCPGKAAGDMHCKVPGDGSSGKDSCGACKAGYNCKTSQSFEPAFSLAVGYIPTRSTTPGDTASILISYSSDELWRPPTLS